MSQEQPVSAGQPGLSPKVLTALAGLNENLRPVFTLLFEQLHSEIGGVRTEISEISTSLGHLRDATPASAPILS
jgi:hypothetical protein